MSNISDFYVGTTKTFSVTITVDDVAPDISADTVTLRIKQTKTDADGSALVSKAADVASQGASGIAQFTLDPADTTTITPGTYYADVVWVTSGGAEYVITDQRLKLLERVSDA